MHLFIKFGVIYMQQSSTFLHFLEEMLLHHADAGCYAIFRFLCLCLNLASPAPYNLLDSHQAFDVVSFSWVAQTHTQCLFTLHLVMNF